MAQTWDAIHIENEYLRLLVLPELGGQVYLAIDKISGNSLFRESPAVRAQPSGLSFCDNTDCGSAAFFGLEPATTSHIQEHPDGSRTVWCSTIHPITRVKSMHGLCLYAGRAYLEIKVRLFNRTLLPQVVSWTSKATADFSSEIASFPERPKTGLGAENFYGCFDRKRDVGIVGIADHHLLPAREFREVRDRDIAHVQLIASVFTDNTDASFSLAPYETKTFSVWYYLIRDIGVPAAATIDAALAVTVNDASVRIGLQVTRVINGAKIQVRRSNQLVSEWTRDVDPGKCSFEETAIPESANDAPLTIVLATQNGRELLRYSPGAEPLPFPSKPPAKPRAPSQIKTVEELYLTGLQLKVHFGGTNCQQEYWEEAVRRSPSDLRSHNALGLWYLQRGEFAIAEKHFRQALAVIPSFPATTAAAEIHYNLGLVLRFLGRLGEAYEALYRSTWEYRWRAPGFLALAEIDVLEGRPDVALDHLRQSLRVNTENASARNLTVALLRRFGASAESGRLVNENLTLDPLDPWAISAKGSARLANQDRLDIAYDLVRAGLYEEAIAVLREADKSARDGSLPLVQYALADIHGRLGRFFEAHQHYSAAAQAAPDYCFPSRLPELHILERATAVNPKDPRAPYYVGNLLYFLGRHTDAIRAWEQSARLDASFPTVWRNLGVAQFNILHNSERARIAFDRAWDLNPADPQLLYERDQLWKRINIPCRERLAELQKYGAIVSSRDDLTLELAALYNQTSQPGAALGVIENHTFAQSTAKTRAVDELIRSRLNLGRNSLVLGDASGAVQQFQFALEASPFGHASTPEISFWMGEAQAGVGNAEAARDWWMRAAGEDRAAPDSTPAGISEQSYYRALALERLDRTMPSRKLLRDILAFSRQLRSADAETKLVRSSFRMAPQIFREDQDRESKIDATYLESQSRLGLGQRDRARRLLELVLGLDRSHPGAADLLRIMSQFPPRSTG